MNTHFQRVKCTPNVASKHTMETPIATLEMILKDIDVASACDVSVDESLTAGIKDIQTDNTIH